MPDEVFWRGQSHRDHVMQVAEQGRLEQKREQDRQKKVQRLSGRESFFNAAYDRQCFHTNPPRPVPKKAPLKRG
jgi:hypothetical protein